MRATAHHGRPVARQETSLSIEASQSAARPIQPTDTLARLVRHLARHAAQDAFKAWQKKMTLPDDTTVE
jgi:hypothetical protein